MGDVGLSMRSGASALQKFGACPEDVWGYDRGIDEAPDEKAILYGTALRLPQYERCDTLAAIKYAIAIEKQAVAVGIPICSDFYSYWTQRNGKIPENFSQDFLGLHGMAFVGYDDGSQMVEAANSWGEEYGDDGFNHIPYGYLAAVGSFDAWTAGFNAIPDAVV